MFSFLDFSSLYTQVLPLGWKKKKPDSRSPPVLPCSLHGTRGHPLSYIHCLSSYVWAVPALWFRQMEAHSLYHFVLGFFCSHLQDTPMMGVEQQLVYSFGSIDAHHRILQFSIQHWWDLRSQSEDAVIVWKCLCASYCWTWTADWKAWLSISFSQS